MDGLVRDQEARKASIEQRGLAVVTTSGTIVTLLFGLVALLTRGDDYRLPGQAHGPLGVALASFGLAAVLGVLTNVPFGYQNVDLDDDKFWEWWDQSAEDAKERVTGTRLKIFHDAKKLNGIKGWLLIGGVAAEVVAVVSLAWTVATILRKAP